MGRGVRGALAVALVPTAVDLVALSVLRQGLGAPLVLADLAAVGSASAVSYVAHRATTFRSHPYHRWVRRPGSFVAIAATAAVVDASVLRLAFTATGFDTLGGLLAAKALALAVALVIRAVGYRLILADTVQDGRSTPTPRISDGVLRLSVVVPAFREGDRIADTVAAIRAELADIADQGGLEIVVVDDGSGDDTAERALGAGADQVLVLPTNRGKGAAVRAGALASRGRAVAFTDADLAYAPHHLRDALLGVEAGWDVVIGNRRLAASTVDGGSVLRRSASRLVNGLASIVLLATPQDTQCGCKAFRGDVARALFARTRIDRFAFDIEVLHLAERAEWSLGQIPVQVRDTGGRSTVRGAGDLVRLLVDLARVRYWSSTGVYESRRVPLVAVPGSGAVVAPHQRAAGVPPDPAERPGT